MTFKKWLKTPKSRVMIVMLAFLLIASLMERNGHGLINGAIAIMTAVLIDVVFYTFQKRKQILPDGSVITGLIIALILGTTTSFLVMIGTVAIAILSKHIVSYKKKPIFNPAAFGLFISVLVFKSQQSWWGAFGDLPWWTLIFILIGGYMITSRVNKYPQVFSFLGTYISLFFLLSLLHIGDTFDALRPPFINATMFFGFFMLTDPPTSPGKPKNQVIFGVLSAIIGTAIYARYGGLIYLFIGLFVGNLYELLDRTIQSKRRSNQKKPKATRSKSVV